MNTALSWIKAYVPDLTCTAQEYTDAMTLSGTKVEGYESLDKNLDKIVVGQIESIEKHPDADKLIICQVNIGNETIQIVTGAPNVKVGDKVEKNQTLVTIEAMKMETAVTARMSGTIASVEVREGDTVKGGQLLLTIQ